MSFQELVTKAKVAERAERYKDMLEYVTQMANKSETALDTEQRNLLSVACKNVVGGCRAAWRALGDYESSVTDDAEKAIVDGYRKTVVKADLRKVCNDTITIVDSLVTKCAESKGEDADAGRVFFLKMKGDYYRYLSETELEQRTSEPAKAADAAYQAAMEAASALPPTNPIRLGVVLNYSVFHYEILDNSEKAQQLATDAFNGAISELDSLGDEEYKDATLIMQLIRDNLTLWSPGNDA